MVDKKLIKIVVKKLQIKKLESLKSANEHIKNEKQSKLFIEVINEEIQQLEGNINFIKKSL